MPSRRTTLRHQLLTHRNQWLIGTQSRTTNSLKSFHYSETLHKISQAYDGHFQQCGRLWNSGERFVVLMKRSSTAMSKYATCILQSSMKRKIFVGYVCSPWLSVQYKAQSRSSSQKEVLSKGDFSTRSRKSTISKTFLGWHLQVSGSPVVCI